MEHEPGDDYIRRISAYIRENEARLARAGFNGRRRKAQSLPNTSIFNPLGWVGLADTNVIQPMALSIDTHRLFYLLMRLEALSIDIGTLDVQVDNLSRPLSYISFGLDADKAETRSIAESFRSSLSAVSRLSLGGGWWGKAELASIEAELKFVYSSFTKLPALSLCAPGPKMIAELVQDPPMNNAIPLDAFKNLQSLECIEVDPRALLGWDRLAESLRSLTVKRSGLDNPSEIFIDAVLDDQLRREGDSTRSRIRKLGHRASGGFHSSNLPDTVHEEPEEDEFSDEQPPSSSPSAAPLPAMKWAFLKHLCLADNSLTVIPSTMLSVLTSLTHLDLSSNLLVSVPSLSMLYNLVSLNLSDNMIDSVLGIYTKLGQLITLNLSRNRLESLCGLERLMALERIDLRHNHVVESAEVGRLAVLPNVSEVWIEGNPLVEEEENYRVRCFNHFWKEGKTIALDGSLPGFSERRGLMGSPAEQGSRTSVALYSPPSLPTGGPTKVSGPSTPASSSAPSPSLAAVVAKPKKRRNKRIVALDGGDSDYRSSEDAGRVARSRSPPNNRGGKEVPLNGAQADSVASDRTLSSSPDKPTRHTRHSRHRTEFAAAPPSPDDLTIGSPMSGTGSLGRGFGTYATSKRRNRISASVYEPRGGDATSREEEQAQMKDAEAFRAKIEALRAEMGDNWLQVFSQSQFRTDQNAKR